MILTENKNVLEVYLKTIKPIEITVFSVVGLLLNIYSFKNSDLFCKLVCFCKVVFTLARISPGHDVCCVNATCLCTVIFFPTHFSPYTIWLP